MLLTGCGIPAIRAAIMTAAVYSGRIFFRKSDPLNSLCGAGLLIIVAAPYAVTSASFLLSFSATSGLFLLSPILLRWITDRLPLCLRRFSGIFRIAVLTFSAGLAILPLSIAFFGGISLIAPISNVMAAPLFPVILCSGFLALTGIPGFVRRRRKTQLVLPWAFSGGNRPACETAVCLFGGAQPFCFFLSSFICGRSPSFLASQAEHAFLYKAVLPCCFSCFR